MKTLKKVDYLIISELIKNSKISDRTLAKKIGMSQPTVTRRRASLEKRGLLNYTAIPDLPQLGFEIMAINFIKWKPERLETMATSKKHQEHVYSFLKKHPTLILVAAGRGLGMSRVGITFHRNYAEYNEFAEAVERDWGDSLLKSESFIISLKSKQLLRFLDFKPLAEHIEKRAHRLEADTNQE